MSNYKPLITIATVVFNGEKVLEKTLRSVCNQTYSNIEYLIIDGGSTDSTLDIIHKYSSQISNWVSEKDQGIYDAMNKAIDHASGEWLCFMNADDKFFSDNTISDLFENNDIADDIDVLYGDTAFDYSDYTITVKAKGLEGLDKGMVFSHQSCFIRTDYHKKNKYSLNYSIAADFDFFRRAYKRGRKFKYSNTIISIMSLGGLSDSNRFETLKQNHKIVNQDSFSILKNIYFTYSYIDLFIRNFAKAILPKVTVAYLTKNKHR